MKAMKGKGRPELSWEARSPKISILPPVYIKKRGKIKRGIVKRQRQRTLTWWWERTHVHGGKEEQTVFQLRMKAEAATPKSVDERVPWASSFVPIYRINPQNQRLDRREREREREREPNNQNETLALDLATISGPEVTHQAVDFGFGALDLGFGAHSHR